MKEGAVLGLGVTLAHVIYTSVGIVVDGHPTRRRSTGWPQESARGVHGQPPTLPGKKSGRTPRLWGEGVGRQPPSGPGPGSV